MRYARTTTIILIAVLALGLAGCAGSGGSGSGDSGYGGSGGTSGAGSSGGATTVVEKDLAFDPASLEVKVGDTVTFTNEDSAQHVVKIDDKELGAQGQGESVTWTAEKPGTYPYVCTIHPSMTGEIVVK